MPTEANKEASKASRRDALGAAFDKASASEEETPAEGAEETPAEAAADVESAEAEVEGEGGGEDGGEGESGAPAAAAAPPKPGAKGAPADKEAGKKPAKNGAQPGEKEKPAKNGAQPGEKEKPAEGGAKAPASWKPAAREAWAKVPDEVKAEVARREKELAGAAQRLNQAEKFIEPMQKVFGPYVPIAKAQGMNVLSLAENALALGAGLHSGSDEHKGKLLATLMKTFKIPVDSVNDALVALGIIKAPEEAPAEEGAGAEEEPTAAAAAKGKRQPAAAPQQFRDPRVDDLQKQLAEQKAQREAAAARQQQALTERANQEIEQFAQEHEFFDDVRPMMKLLIDGAVAAGDKSMDLERAYEIATSSDKGIQKIMRQREEGERVKERQEAAKRARAAGSSVRSAPAGGGGQGKPRGIRGSLETAWDEVEGRDRT